MNKIIDNQKIIRIYGTSGPGSDNEKAAIDLWRYFRDKRILVKIRMRVLRQKHLLRRGQR